MKININTTVAVNLSALGARLYNRHFDEVPKEFRPPKREAGDKIEIQLWSLMTIFGNAMYAGAPEVPFENNEIEIIEKDLDG